ncbi:MAG TPA: hypothetical protein VFR41_05765 [Acidimicrobiia bacterium]|nr:hypothetical protein [Acidimicrobiia bacterium]
MTLCKCAWCGRKLTPNSGAGRPKRYCRRSCRQRHYEAEQRARELGLGESELVVAREELESLRDRLFALSCALDELDETSADDHDRALTEVMIAARAAVAS